MGRLTDRHYAGPPRWAVWLLSRFSPPGLEDELQGDMMEMYTYWVKTVGLRGARWRYEIAVLRLIRPFTWPSTRQSHDYSQPEPHRNAVPRRTDRITSSLHPAMIRNYLKLAWRNLQKNPMYAFINIGGLAVGMAAAMLIGLWIYDELRFNQYHSNYDRIAQVMQQATVDGKVESQVATPAIMAPEIRARYGRYFKYVVQASWVGSHILSVGNTHVSKEGIYFEPHGPSMLGLRMRQGTYTGLADPSRLCFRSRWRNPCLATKARWGS
jgi:putative ABC transport system permease protein